MVAESVPTRFTLDPARGAEFIEDLSSVENSLLHVAEKWNTTTGALSLFLASPEGLAIVAAAEIATAIHVRLQAQALLADVAQSMVYIVREYSREERRIPFNNDLRSIRLVEMRRANARRAGHLLLRLSHYNPAPIRSYTVNTEPLKEPTPPQGGTPKPRTSSLTSDASDFTIASAVPPLVGVAAPVASAPAPIFASVCHDHPSISKDDRASSRSTPTHTSATDLTPTMSESASEIVVHVGEANTSLLREVVAHARPQEHGAAFNLLRAAGRAPVLVTCSAKRAPQLTSTTALTSGP
jgi:hypothetical protein